MDLTQCRLSRNEWEAIEVPVAPEEQRVGRMLLEAAHAPSMRRNRAQSLATYLQIKRSPATSHHFWTAYLQPELAKGMDGCTRSAPGSRRAPGPTARGTRAARRTPTPTVC